MRLRNIKGASEKLKKHTLVIDDPKSYKGKWQEYFKNNYPIYIEIGMGMGNFIKGMALKYPNINFIGFEKFTNVLVRALKKFDEPITNIALVRMDIVEIEEVFDKNEIDRIYLNFSDPWSKDRYLKRRLTYRKFLELYKNVLKKNGEVHFKTDNERLFEFSIEELETCGWTLKNITRDLHNSKYLKDNVMTEYEAKFVSLGQTIFRLEAVKPQ